MIYQHTDNQEKKRQDRIESGKETENKDENGKKRKEEGRKRSVGKTTIHTCSHCVLIEWSESQALI